LKQEIISLVEKLLQKTNVPVNKVMHIYLGLAGAGRKSDQKTIKELFDDTEFKTKISVNSDAIIALAGAFGNRPGIILIAGTGTICFGKNSKGDIIRSGGWGYLLGDEGSGYYIGREAILAALKDFDGRGEGTTLRKILMSKFGLESMDQIIPLIYQNKLDRIKIADLAPIVFEEAKKVDTVALQIIKQAGNEIGKLAKAVALRLGFSDENIKIALIGSIFKQKEMLVNEISKELFEISWNIELTAPEFDPALGAAILALEASGIFVDDIFLDNLKKSAKNYVQYIE
jgi:N-acetylglucosamine kinase-like BadF-type ATPase